MADGSTAGETTTSTDPDIADLAGRVGDQVDALSGSMRDLVWAIRPEERSWDDLELRIKDAAVRLLAPHGIEADLKGEVDGAVPVVAAEICQNVLLFTKEAIHNAIRHAGASRIEGRWRVTRHALSLSIADDGRGFDASTARRGVGLLSMRRRAETLGGTFDLATAPGDGTRVTLEVPLRRM
jgi:signal transduction histidine kinase